MIRRALIPNAHASARNVTPKPNPRVMRSLVPHCTALPEGYTRTIVTTAVAGISAIKPLMSVPDWRRKREPKPVALHPMRVSGNVD